MNELPTRYPDSATHPSRRYPNGFIREIIIQIFTNLISSGVLAVAALIGSLLGLGVLNEMGDTILLIFLGTTYIVSMTALITIVRRLEGLTSLIGIAALIVICIVSILFFRWVYSHVEWPPTTAEYYSFEKDKDLEGWSEGSQRTEEKFYSGKHSLKANFRMPLQEASAMNAELRWDKVFIADVIVGNMYFPASQNYLIENILVCLETEQHGAYCEPVSTQFNQWNTFVLILSDMNLEGAEVYLDDVVIEHLYFQIGIRSVNGTRSADVPFYLDNLQIYRDGSS